MLAATLRALRERVNRPNQVARPCANSCGITIAPGRGVRGQGGWFCSDECHDAFAERSAY